MRHQRLIAAISGLSMLLSMVLPWMPLGPILQPRPAQAVIYTPLNNQRAKDYAIIRVGATWHVFAIWCDITLGCDAQRRGLMHLTSTNLTQWTEVGYVLAPEGGSDFDDFDVWAPSIVERNGTYYMYYTGVYKNGSNTYVQKIGLATSTDLTTWTKHSATTPVFDCTSISGVYYNPADNSDGAACRDPYVFWDEGEHQWVMSVSSRRTGSVPANNMSIALATSEDLVTWRPYGFISATDDYIAESSHIFKHGSTYYMVYTENGSGTDYIDYLTSTNIYTGWTRIGDLSQASQYEYASEYISDRGHDYFTRIDADNLGIDFDEITWTGTPFSFSDPAYGAIGNDIWNDVDADGVHDVGEVGIDGVTVRAYLDNGDAVFSAATDYLYATTTSGDDPNTVGTQHGYYALNTVLPDTYWVEISPTNYANGQPLAGMSGTTPTVYETTISAGQQNTDRDFGFSAQPSTWSMDSGSVSVNAAASLVNGRAIPAPTSSAATWWDPQFHFRKNITVSAQATTLTTDKTIVIHEDLGALVSAGKLQASYADLRVVYWNGATNQIIDVDVIDSTTQRFKVQSSISSSSSDSGYYLYYGAPGAVARPTRLANVYEYYSSFNSPDGTTYGTWAENGGSNWQISGNKWRQLTTTTGDRFSRDTAKVIDLRQDWAEEATMTIANSGTSKVGGITFHSQQAFGAEAYWMNLYAGTSQKINFYHWAWSQTSFTPAEATGLTIPTGTPQVARFEYVYNSAASRVLRSYQNNALRLTTNENMGGGDLVYDIWYQDTCPCNDAQAYFALNTYEGDVSFNDVKGWQLHDGTTSTASETAYIPSDVGVITTSASTTFGAVTSFTADGLNQGGTITFVLSNDGGSTWLYWNGTNWVATNQTIAQSNSSAVIDANIATFPTGSGQFMWRALLGTNTDTLPMLTRVAASFNQPSNTPTQLTPAAGLTTDTLRPTFTFSGNDTDGDALQYEIQFDTVPTFDSSHLMTASQWMATAQWTANTGWSGQDALSGSAYASGSVATFIPPTALPNGTLYWRVRAKDVSGSGTYTAYTSARAFQTPDALTIQTITSTPTDSSASLTWTTNNLATATVEYGPTTTYGQTLTLQTADRSHTTDLSNLAADTVYYYRLTATDSYGQQAIASDSFRTAPNTLVAVTAPTLLTPILPSPKNPRLTVRGTGHGQQTIIVRLDGKILKMFRLQQPAGTVPSFKTNVNVQTLRAGTHRITARAVEADGRTSSIVTQQFTVENGIRARVQSHSGGLYIVQRGESLWGLARRFLKSGTRWNALLQANIRAFPSLLTNPKILKSGWTLTIPSIGL